MKNAAFRIRAACACLWLGAAALLMASYLGVYRPMQASIDSRWDDVAQTRARDVAGRAILRRAAEVRAARARLRGSMADVLLSTNQQGEDAMLDAVTTAARRAGVVVTSVEPSSNAAVQRKGPFSVLPTAIGVRGTFAALLAFLSGVNDARALFEVGGVAISPARSSAGRVPLLEMQINAALYRSAAAGNKE